MYSGRCWRELDATYLEDAFNSVQSVKFIAANVLVVHDVIDLQVVELAPRSPWR